MQLALFQPDIPQNVGTLIRFCACLGIKLHIIEPCGFPFDEKKLKRAAMDYADMADVTRHRDWQSFCEFFNFTEQKQSDNRLILATTKGALPYTECCFTDRDIILLGRESAGAPEMVHQRADERIFIPMQPKARSLNIAISGAMITGEALRQVG